MKLRPVLVVCALLAGAVLAPTAAAQKPVKEPLMTEPIEFAAGDVCAFPVRVETIAGNASIKTLANGRELMTGSGTEHVTNLASGESVDLKVAGSILFAPLPNGNLRIVGHGRTLIFLLPQDVGGPGLILITGRVAQVLDLGTDSITSFRLSGRRMDVCAALTPASP